jgi:hypothetical protein
MGWGSAPCSCLRSRAPSPSSIESPRPSPAVGKLLNFYNPVGTLSGVTTVTIVVWLATWFVLGRLWGNKTIALGAVNIVAFASLAIGLLLTFPPFMDLLQGK